MAFRALFEALSERFSARIRRDRPIPPVVTEPTGKRFVLLLRPSDNGMLAALDAVVARAAATVAQVVGIGAPPIVGGVFTAGDFRRLSERAIAILLPREARPGLHWELAKLEKNHLLSKCLVFDPATVSERLPVSALTSEPLPVAVERLRCNLTAGIDCDSHSVQ